jgi:transposase
MEKRRKFTREFKLEAVRLIKERGVSYAQASQDLGVHVSQLRNWVKALADDPQHAFPGHGQMKPEQEEIAQLKREVAKLKAERDILKNCHGLLSRTVVRLRAVETVRANLAPWRVAAVSLLEAQSPLKNVVHGCMRT